METIPNHIRGTPKFIGGYPQVNGGLGLVSCEHPVRRLVIHAWQLILQEKVEEDYNMN